MCESKVPGTISCKQANIAEGAAISTSLLCLVHCLALPVLVILPGTIGLFVRSEDFHYVALALVTPFAVLTLTRGYRWHRVALPAILGAAGVLLLAAALVPQLRGLESHVTAVGSLMLVAAHVFNWRLRADAA